MRLEPSCAQVSSNSTQSEWLKRQVDELRDPGKTERRLRANKNLDGSAIFTTPVDQLKIEKLPVPSLKLRDLKRGGVHSGGGDEIGLEFIAAVREAIFDAQLYSFLEKDDFPWFDLMPFASTLSVVAQETPLTENGEPTLSVAMNDVSTKTILVQRSIWNSIQDRRIRNLIALNQTILMMDGKSRGYSEQALRSAQSQGLSGLVLWNAKPQELSAKEKADSATHQCVWSFKSLQRAAVLLESEAQECVLNLKTPEQYQIRVLHAERLTERCVTSCSATPDSLAIAKKCRDYVQTRESMVSTVKRLAPQCLIGGKR